MRCAAASFSVACRAIINNAAVSLRIDAPWSTVEDHPDSSDHVSIAADGGSVHVPREKIQSARGSTRAAECNISGGWGFKGCRRQTSCFPARTSTPTVMKLKHGLQKVS